MIVSTHKSVWYHSAHCRCSVILCQNSLSTFMIGQWVYKPPIRLTWAAWRGWRLPGGLQVRCSGQDSLWSLLCGSEAYSCSRNWKTEREREAYQQIFEEHKKIPCIMREITSSVNNYFSLSKTVCLFDPCLFHWDLTNKFQQFFRPSQRVEFSSLNNTEQVEQLRRASLNSQKYLETHELFFFFTIEKHHKMHCILQCCSVPSDKVYTLDIVKGLM